MNVENFGKGHQLSNRTMFFNLNGDSDFNVFFSFVTRKKCPGSVWRAGRQERGAGGVRADPSSKQESEDDVKRINRALNRWGGKRWILNFLTVLNLQIFLLS